VGAYKHSLSTLLFELSENKLATVADMNTLGRGVNGDQAWKWFRRLLFGKGTWW